MWSSYTLLACVLVSGCLAQDIMEDTKEDTKPQIEVKEEQPDTELELTEPEQPADCGADVVYGECHRHPETFKCIQTGSPPGVNCLQTQGCQDSECSPLNRRQKLKLNGGGRRKHDHKGGRVRNKIQKAKKEKMMKQKHQAKQRAKLNKKSKHQVALCNLPAQVGVCRASILSWYYNSEDMECQTFNYGGCKGNDNRFTSQQDCEAACGKAAAKPQQECRYKRREREVSECVDGERTISMTLMESFAAQENCNQTKVVTKKCSMQADQVKMTRQEKKEARQEKKEARQEKKQSIHDKKEVKKDKKQQKKQKLVQRKQAKKESRKESRKEKKQNDKPEASCIYDDGDWSDCMDSGAPSRQRIDTLASGSDGDCPPSRTLTQDCNAITTSSDIVPVPEPASGNGRRSEKKGKRKERKDRRQARKERRRGGEEHEHSMNGLAPPPTPKQ